MRKRETTIKAEASRVKYLSTVLMASSSSLDQLNPPDMAAQHNPVGDDVMQALQDQMSFEVEDTEDGNGQETADGGGVASMPLLSLQTADNAAASMPVLSLQQSGLAAIGPNTRTFIRSKPRSEKKRCKSFRPLGRYDRSSSCYDEVDRSVTMVNPDKHKFPFENLVFEGGGNKGLAYCGALRCLEEQSFMNQVKGLAGASAGGMFAALVAVGYTSYEIEQFLSERIDHIFLDARCGYCSLLPNLVRSFGWNPGERIFRWFGDKLQEKTGNADITFHEVYNRYGKLLCVVVTNLNQMTTEYCHPKTTPFMPIRTAVRMSMAIPGLFKATKYERLGNLDVFVDGGVLCNYPIHCFDGWYLSMERKDSFIRRLQPLRDIPILMERQNCFGEFNEKTLGMLLYSDAEEDILRISLERRVGCLVPPKPETDTKLYKF